MLVPEHAGALNELVRTLSTTGDVDAAIAEYEKIDALAHDIPETLNALGALHAGQNRLEIAEEYFWRALGEAPNDTDVAANLGNLLAKTFRTDEALTLYSGALSAAPDDPRIFYAMSVMPSATVEIMKAPPGITAAHLKSMRIISTPMPASPTTCSQTGNIRKAGVIFCTVPARAPSPDSLTGHTSRPTCADNACSSSPTRGPAIRFSLPSF